jgi:hypothetical protein
MSAPEYQIGCTVFWGSFESSENHVECPDCGGTGRLRVILHDETQVSIECDTCKLGYHGPSGRIRIYDRKPIVRSGEISGVETRREGGFEYRITHFALDDDGRMYQGSYTVNDDRVFTNEDEAMKIAMATAEEDKNERDRILRKREEHPVVGLECSLS